jgi:host factor-I protein
MAAENPQRLQDTFLDYLLKQRTPVTIFLVNGVKLQGIVTAHDNFCILLSRDGQSQAVYKQAISTIASNYPIELWEGAEKKTPAAPTLTPRQTTVVVERKPPSRRPPSAR